MSNSRHITRALNLRTRWGQSRFSTAAAPGPVAAPLTETRCETRPDRHAERPSFGLYADRVNQSVVRLPEGWPPGQKLRQLRSRR